MIVGILMGPTFNVESQTTLLFTLQPKAVACGKNKSKTRVTLSFSLSIFHFVPVLLHHRAIYNRSCPALETRSRIIVVLVQSLPWEWGGSSISHYEEVLLTMKKPLFWRTGINQTIGPKRPTVSFPTTVIPNSDFFSEQIVDQSAPIHNTHINPWLVCEHGTCIGSHQGE